MTAPISSGSSADSSCSLAFCPRLGSAGISIRRGRRRQQPRRPVIGQPAVAERGQVRVRLLRAGQREHVRPGLEQRARFPRPGRGQRLAVKQERDAVGAAAQRLDDGLPGRAAGPDHEPGRVGGQPRPGHPDLAVGRGAQRERAEPQPVHRPRRRPADHADLGQPARLGQRGGRRRPGVDRDQRAVPEHRGSAGPRIHRPPVQPQGLLGGGAARGFRPGGPPRGFRPGGPRRDSLSGGRRRAVPGRNLGAGQRDDRGERFGSARHPAQRGCDLADHGTVVGADHEVLWPSRGQRG
jgi:hypothetical protein